MSCLLEPMATRLHAGARKFVLCMTRCERSGELLTKKHTVDWTPSGPVEFLGTVVMGLVADLYGS